MRVCKVCGKVAVENLEWQEQTIHLPTPEDSSHVVNSKQDVVIKIQHEI